MSSSSPTNADLKPIVFSGWHCKGGVFCVLHDKGKITSQNSVRDWFFWRDFWDFWDFFGFFSGIFGIFGFFGFLLDFWDFRDFLGLFGLILDSLVFGLLIPGIFWSSFRLLELLGFLWDFWDILGIYGMFGTFFLFFFFILYRTFWISNGLLGS